MNKKSQWITVGDLAEGFRPESYILSNYTLLAGKELTLYAEDGYQITYQFTQDTISWHDHHKQTQGKSSYRATSIRDGICLVDYIDGNNQSVSVVLDDHHQCFTAVIGQLPSESECQQSLYARALSHQPLTAVKVSVFHGGIGQTTAVDRCPHHETDELIGIRNLYRYSPTEAYEHIYLNQHFYTWQCLSGVEKGLADTDRCHYYKIADELYLFVWLEKIIPTLGVVLIDLKQHRSDGKICGYKTGSFTELSNFPVSSHCTLMNKTDYV